ncbi:hypothetical protein AKJ16_DCAP11289, partial [Drosera capensis]
MRCLLKSRFWLCCLWLLFLKIGHDSQQLLPLLPLVDTVRSYQAWCRRLWTVFFITLQNGCAAVR